MPAYFKLYNSFYSKRLTALLLATVSLALLPGVGACGETTVLSVAPTSRTGLTASTSSSAAPTQTPAAISRTPGATTAPASPEGTAAATNLPGRAATASPTALPQNTRSNFPQPTPLPSTSPRSGPAGTTATPIALQDDREITFTSGKTTLYGSLLLPNSASGKLPAALLIAGSGPTDRNGNNRLIGGEINTQLNFARTLAAQGVASLRYDKLGTGKTGLPGGPLAAQDSGFQTFVDEARAAYEYLKNRPEIDPQRLMILGHSEGGLIALVLADQLKTGGPRGLILAAPLSRPYLDTIRLQLTTQYAEGQQTGLVTRDQAETALAELEKIIKSLQDSGKYPAAINTPVLKQIFSPANEKFLAEVSRYDPAKLAAGLPATLPALVMCGQKDLQIGCSEVQQLMNGFQRGGNVRAKMFELVEVNHVFKEVPGAPRGAIEYGNPDLSFSLEAERLLAEFIKDVG